MTSRLEKRVQIGNVEMFSLSQDMDATHSLTINGTLSNIEPLMSHAFSLSYCSKNLTRNTFSNHDDLIKTNSLPNPPNIPLHHM